ncbi:MAG: M28 family peptidase, partial [Acidobacteriota bacterium]|nr:M28 family peptidase [Acidobacteriota bacterium]
LALAALGCLHAAQPGPPKFDGSRAYEDVRQLVAIGTRVAGTPGAQAARDYIRKQLKAAGLTVEEQPFDATTPLGRVKMVNLRVTLPAAQAQSAASGARSAARLVIGGHYDTKRFKEFTFVGANDGGSSAAFLIELGRALKSRANRVPIELLFLDGEEAVVDWQGQDHTYGSRYYVEAARKDGTLKNIRAFILVDMIGDHNLVIKREGNSTPSLIEAIWSAAKRLNRREFVDEIYPVEDDHLEFLAAHVPSVDLIDLEYSTRSGEVAWHTRHDTLENVAAGSLQAVGDVLLAALPEIEKRQ